MMLKNLFMIHLFVLMLSTSGIYSQRSCPINCQVCPSNPEQCEACSQHYELTSFGKCNSQSLIQNCMHYGSQSNCLKCKPTFRLFNICVQMYDGCLIASSGGVCLKCISGAFRNQFGSCNVKYIHCTNVDMEGKCSQCEQNYQLVGGQCRNSQKVCKQKNQNNGLCLNCLSPYILHNYKCVQRQQIFGNCYLMNDDLTSCIYCKNGYRLFYQKCFTQYQVNTIIYGNFLERKFYCKSGQFYNRNLRICEKMPAYCDQFDYGLMKCAFCLDQNVLSDGVCRDVSLRFCKKINDDNPYLCQQCKPKFFLNNNRLCSPYPLNCEFVLNGICVKCISQFLLNKQGYCQDPNCQKINLVTFECQACKTSYIMNKTKGQCVFKDLHCEQENPPQSQIACKKCKTDYQYDSQKRVCKFVDPDCKILSGQICLECNSGYYLNSIVNFCMPLPFKCESANSIGDCNYCDQGYALQTDRKCHSYNTNNCKINSQINIKVCKQCKSQYYLDHRTGLCVELPILCNKFDTNTKKCIICNNQAELKSGKCYDRFCQYFTQEAECLGCRDNYMFNQWGYCVKETKDQNCKQFMNGLCKTCSDRYYFNKDWKCVMVHNLCNGYNPNNGECTSCHIGYLLQNGKCVLSVQASDKCIEFSKDKLCLKCKQGYYLFQGECNDYIIGCLEFTKQNLCKKCIQNFILEDGICVSSVPFQKPVPIHIDSNCLDYDDQEKFCRRCIDRMYYDSSSPLCQKIDENCKNYQKNGDCLQCYPGYTVSSIDNKICRISQPEDPNCKIRSDPQMKKKCLECYQGYYYAQNKEKCVIENKLCKETNSSNGDCKSCWDGYGLVNGQCISVQNCVAYENSLCIGCMEGYSLSSNQCTKNLSSKSSNNIQNSPSISSTLCLKVQQGTLKCIQCITAAVFDEDTKQCEYPLHGKDQFCQIYRNKNCVECKPKYLLSNFKCIKIDENCIKFNDLMTQCLECKDKKQPQKLTCI